MSARIAVTGASGFIGRHAVRALLKDGADVVAVTRNAQRLAEFGKSIDIFETDIGAVPADVFARLGSPVGLLHLAWDGLPNYRSLHHFETELPKHYAFLKSLVAGGLQNIVVTGTCFEYGMRSGSLSEAAVCEPCNPYGFAKHSLRQELTYLQNIVPFGMTWARLFYMYGEGQPAGSLWPQLQAAIARGDTHFNMSGGEQLRDFLPVAEVASALANLTLNCCDVGIVNVCSGEPRSVRDLVEGWIQDAGATIQLNLGHYPYPDYEPMSFWGDRERLNRVLGS